MHASLNARRRPQAVSITLGNETNAGAAVTAASPSQAAQKNAAREDLDRALSGLPDRQRMVVHLRLWDQLTFATIGERLGLSEDAARMLYGRAIARLRKSVRPGHDPG